MACALLDYPALKAEYDKNGFVVIPAQSAASLIPTAEELAALRAAADRVIGKTRSGEWTRRRVVGKQFPPFDLDNPDSWGVQHIMHPELGEKIFVEWYISDPVLEIVQALLGVEKDVLQLGTSSGLLRLALFIHRGGYCS